MTKAVNVTRLLIIVTGLFFLLSNPVLAQRSGLSQKQYEKIDWLGITALSSDAFMSGKDGMESRRAVMQLLKKGIYGLGVEEVESGSLAERLGLRKDDRILYINKKKMNSLNDIKDIAGPLQPGDEIVFNIMRSARTIEISGAFGNKTEKQREEQGVKSKTELKVFAKLGHSMNITSVALTPDGRYAVSGDQDNTLRLWDIKTGRVIRTFDEHGSWASSVAISPDGKYVLSGSKDKTLKLWDIGSGRVIRTFEGHGSFVSSVAISPDGRYGLSGSGGTLKLWDIETGREIRTFTHKGRVASVAFSPDQRFVVSCGQYKGLLLWDIDSGRIISNVEGKSSSWGWNRSVAVSPNGRYVAYANFGFVNIWDTAAGKYLTHLNIKQQGNALAFSPDSRHLISGSQDGADGAIGLWNVETGTEIKTFKGHKGEVMSLAFSPQGESFISASHDGSIRRWDIKTGSEIIQFISFTGGEWIAMTPEGYFNASANGAKYLNVRVGNKVYGIDQFYTKFYRPELVQLALAGKELPKGETFGDILAKKPAPTVRILSPATGSAIDTDSITLSLRISDSGGGIGNVMIYLNGSLVANETRGVMVKDKGPADEKTTSFTIPLMAGQNDIRVIAFNNENSMESSPALVSVISKAVMQKPNLYALVIGINEYKNKSISLTYAVKDAEAFAQVLQKMAGPLFEKIAVQVLTTPAATTKVAITTAFEGLRLKMKPNDLFVFYNASHGLVDVVDGEEQYFLLSSNVLLLSSRHIGKDAMSQKELAKLIGNIPAQKKVVILDTCNAGKGGREIQVALLQQTRGLTDSTAVKLLQRAIGSAVFSASSDTQLALEGYKGHGLFTYVLLEGLQGKADIKKDGYITVLGLADYVEENVIKLSEEVFKRQQTPTIQTGANFPIGKMR